ncbi:MAG: transketolase C-terminal domain-containing protein, partial [Cyclobacteriaceae bacterium]
GLLLSALADPNPVLFFEHKALYRSLNEEIPDAYYTCPIGEAKLTQEGSDVSIITYGMGVQWAGEFLAAHPEINADVLDLRSLLPWDQEAVATTVQKTGRVLILHEDCQTGGIGGEIAAWISESCFQHLDAPVSRLGSLDTAVPFSSNLEDNFLPKGRLEGKLNELLAF